MVWWQGVLISLGSIVAGLIIGLLPAYVILRIQKRPWPFSRGYRGMTVAQEQIELVAKVRDAEVESGRDKHEVTVSEERTTSTTRRHHEDIESIRKHQEAVEGEEQVNSRMSSILGEVEMNLAVAATPWMGKLSPFRTDVWDAGCGDEDYLPSNCQHELVEAYADMHLANKIVWLSTDVGRRSKDLDESYIKMCAQITERLNRVNPSLKG